MKKIFSFAFGALLFVSCSPPSFIQVVDVKGNVPMENNNFVYSDNVVKITYSMWAKRGNPGFVIENISDKTVYVDLANTFYIENGTAHDYFLNRTHSSSSSSTYATTLSSTSVAFGIWSLSKLPSKVSSTTSSSSTKGSTSGVSYSEKPIIAIPPHSHKAITEYTIADDVIEDCSVKLFPKQKDPQSVSFTEQNTPIRFTNYITYRVSEDATPVVVTNDFYVAGFTNYTKKEITETIKVGCKEQATEKYNTKAAGNRYYITYKKNHRNRYSADCKTENYYNNK
ncbi:MAG: hypothetical protein ACI4B5_00030 [Bacteroidaceae bacterium]